MRCWVICQEATSDPDVHESYCGGEKWKAVPKIRDLAERREADEVAVENNDAVQVNEGTVRQSFVM